MTARERHPSFLALSTLLMAALFAFGCATEDAAPEETAEPAAEDAMPEDDAAAGAATAYFVNIEDGGTYTSPLEIIFGADDFEIVPVEDPPVVREGEGHYHLAVDVECAAAGEVIVQGNPSYIHFGSGADRITMQFEPGEHRLCLQVADGEHRVLAGPEAAALTQEITITIEEAGS